MAEPIERFNLVRTGFVNIPLQCGLNLFFSRQYSAASENCTYEDGSIFNAPGPARAYNVLEVLLSRILHS